MLMPFRRSAVPALLAVLFFAGCKESTSPTPTAPAQLAGLEFELTGTSPSVVSGALPSPDASFTAPLVSQDRAPSASSPATLTVGSAEDFNTVLIRPTGASSYVRIPLPAQTRLIGISVRTVSGSVSIATSVSVAVAMNARTSAAATHSFFPIGN